MYLSVELRVGLNYSKILRLPVALKTIYTKMNDLSIAVHSWKKQT